MSFTYSEDVQKKMNTFSFPLFSNLSRDNDRNYYMQLERKKTWAD